MGAGFIGTRLGRRLLAEKNNSICIIDKAKSPIGGCEQIIADIVNPIELQSNPKSIDVLVNLAAEHRDDVSPKTLYDDVNVTGAINVCNFARKSKVSKIIFTSSVAVYGFTEVGADESSSINPYGDYGRTKWEAECIYREWQAESPGDRSLVIVRPTVVFGERNRGNVYNLLRQIASGRFLMIGNGLNKKSMAYVENVAAFLQYSIGFGPGLHVYNYVDKPDFSMNELVEFVNKVLGKAKYSKLKIPFFLGLCIGYCFDLISYLTKNKFPISSIRVRKFCANSLYNTSICNTEFSPPASLLEALEETINFEFVKN